MPTIRIDDDVYEWLQSLATPFDDTPNTVLRRVAELGEEEGIVRGNETNRERLSARKLMRRWNVDVRHGLYHRDGTFYENLRRFPGALFDPHGYVVFETEEEYQRSPHLQIGQKLNVPEGIASLPGYIQVE